VNGHNIRHRCSCLEGTYTNNNRAANSLYGRLRALLLQYSVRVLLANRAIRSRFLRVNNHQTKQRLDRHSTGFRSCSVEPSQIDLPHPAYFETVIMFSWITGPRITNVIEDLQPGMHSHVWRMPFH
jgi:hypothetical protein